ncbi:MAG: ribonuclease P protein component [Firmicutes bacterium]|nr:ribonuclease P protein component [Bacillota bacterium]
MKKQNIIKSNIDFNRIINNNKSYRYKDYIVYLEKTDASTYHFGLSVGKKIGNAVMRNRIKRQLKAIIDKNNYEKGINCIIIVRKGILEKSFAIMEEELNKIFENLKIKKENANEK